MSRENTRTPDLIIKAGILLTMNHGLEVLRDTVVVVSKGRIVDILPEDRDQVSYEPAKEVLDASGHMVLPGLVNAHTHAAMTLFRGYADDLPLKQWLFDKIFPAEARLLSPESVFWGAMLGFAEMISTGTTCFMDGYFFQDQTLLAAMEVGIRGLAAQGVIDFPAPGVPDPAKNLEVGEAFLKEWAGASQLVRPGLFCHSPVTCSEETLGEAMEICERYEVPLQIHLSETQDEVNEIEAKTGKRPVFYLDELGLLKSTLVAAHAVHLDENEIERIAETGVRLVHVPESNMKLASGAARVWWMTQAGVLVGLGTDGSASNNNLDLFQEMDMAAKLAKVSSGNPEALDARTTLRMATIWGSYLLGLQDEIGSIEVGKKADLVVLDLDAPHLQPVYDPFSLVVYSASGGDVRDVVVEGRILYKNREFVDLDLEEIKAKVREFTRPLKTGE